MTRMDRRGFLVRAAALVPALLGARALVAQAEPAETTPAAESWLIDVGAIVERIAGERAEPHGIHVEISEASRRDRVTLLFTDLAFDGIPPRLARVTVSPSTAPYLPQFEQRARIAIIQTVCEIGMARKIVYGTTGLTPIGVLS